MSSEEEIEKSFSNDSELFLETEKRSTISYTREFLLSLSELDVCKKFPNGFDPSLLSEFEDSYHGTQARHKNNGSSYSQGVYGRWDSRSSVKSDRDSDSQSDKDSDSGHSYGNQSRKPWQSSEQDRLLGSSSFGKPPPGYATAGLSGPKGRSNDEYQLKKSNESCHPPRPYKAGPLSRRVITDSLNEETFGSAQCASQDQAEEERKRRESFEMMRKEQHKSLQEKQNSTKLVGGSGIGNQASSKFAELDESNNDSSVRPLIPPGFRSSFIEKNTSPHLAHPLALEVGRPDLEVSVSQAIDVVQDGNFETRERLVVHSTHEKMEDNLKNFSSDSEMFDGKDNVADKKVYRGSSLSEESEILGVGETLKDDTKKMTRHNLFDPSAQAQQPSILDKLFGSVLSDNLVGSSGFMEETKQDDPWNTPNVIQSSKLAQWFLQDENKGTQGPPHTRTTDLLSLIGGGEKAGSEISDKHSISDIRAELPKKFYKSCEDETALPILTCEDLEQTILSGFSQKNSTFKTSFGPKEPKVESDYQASQHLLSLLHKGPVLKDSTMSLISETGFSGKAVENVAQSGKSLTLETLFGPAFMKELQSASIDGNQYIDSKRGGFNGAVDIQLPEEDSLIAAAINGESRSFDISDELAALDTSFRNEKPLIHGPYRALDREILFRNHLPVSQMNRFHPLDSHPTHVRPPMNFNPQEGMMMIQRGDRGPAKYQFPAKTTQLHPMLQQMQMQTPDNLPRHLQEFSTGATLPPHHRTWAAGPVHEHNHMQGFSQQQTNFGGPGMTMQAHPEVGGNHPEAFQKLLDMELRANSSKHRHPFASLGNANQGLHSHDLDSSFR